MSNEELQVSRGEGDSPAETLKAQVEAEIKAAADRARAELAEAPPPSVWEVWALGPFQGPGYGPPPGRIIEVNQAAYVITITFLNTFMDTNVSGFGGKIQLNYFTSNTQTMEPVNAMDYTCCICPDDVAGIVIPGLGTFYVTVWEFEPTEAGCILETNICARVCNCSGEVVPDYAAFVRWVANVDFDLFFPPVFFQFDHPIRYLVYDNEDDTNCGCDCKDPEAGTVPLC